MSLATVQMFDSDEPGAKGQVGVVGVPIDCVEDMEVLFRDIPIDRISVSVVTHYPRNTAILFPMYLAMAGVMEDHHAQAITVNCLGGIYSQQMVCAYPCIGFMELDDQGFVGACEADQRSTLTKLIMTYQAGRPGFISDPVIDTSKNQIIYAHCVAPSKVYGPDGPYNPFHIRSHSEDRKGAAIRSLMPLGQMTTTIEFDHNRKQVIFHQGVTVENVDEDMACRSKLAVEVKGDVFKLLNQWDQWGWHRVTFFGDLKREVETLAMLYGFEMLYEA